MSTFNFSRWGVGLLVVILALVCPQMLLAQEDLTAPILLDFTLGPVAFDTGPGPVTVNWCATASDDFSGLNSVHIIGALPLSSGNAASFDGSLNDTVCMEGTVPMFTPYQVWDFGVRVGDVAGNSTTYTIGKTATRLANGTNIEDESTGLCEIGTCQVENRPENALPDADSDGVPDDADNCPNIPNPNQADDDLDLIGNVCDDFPNNRDNAQAQCDQDLATALADLDMCLNPVCLPNKGDCSTGADCCSGKCKTGTCRGN